MVDDTGEEADGARGDVEQYGQTQADASMDRPRTPRGAVGADVPRAPETEDGDGDVLMIRHMVGRRIVAEVDSELIGVAAIEDQRRQQAMEEAQLRQATINSMVDNVQAEADNYLAEVEAEAEAEAEVVAGRETNGADESGDLPLGDQARPGEGSDGAMDQN